MFTGPMRIIGFEKAARRLLRSTLKLSSDDICSSSGSAEGLSFIDEFTLISTTLSPSAGCLLVLDPSLRLRHIFYGYQAAQVLPGQLLLYEDMIHFAPVHPGRLQLADLRTGHTLELYPPKGDPLRAQLTREHARRMPPHAICEQGNDPCSPELFNEDLGSMATDGKGTFAGIAVQSADHALKAETPPETLVAQTVLYVYRQQHGAWFYCEQKVSDAEVESLRKLLEDNLAAITPRCTHTIQVIPDLSTATYNPFLPANPGKQPAPR